MARNRQGLIGGRLLLWGAVCLLGWKLVPHTIHAYRLWWQIRSEVCALSTEKAMLEREQQELRAQLQRLSTPLGKETLARERGWLMPDEQPLQIHTEP